MWLYEEEGTEGIVCLITVYIDAICPLIGFAGLDVF